MSSFKWIIPLVFLGLIGCKKDVRILVNVDHNGVPAHFPKVDYPGDNAYTDARFELGKALFYDPALSVDSSISCVGCHKPEFAFSDNVALSLGVEKRLGTRNSPTLTNVGYLPYYTREGGVPTLEMQILVPIQEHNEFDFNIVDVASRLSKMDKYVNMSLKAYGRLPDPFVIVRAISTFERSMVSGESDYDLFAFGGDITALSAKQQNGMKLFFSEKTNCSKCHGGFNFTTNAFENNGLYKVYADNGRFRLTAKPEDLAKFKVPTLRNIGLTAPYMHDGSVLNLKAVLKHYNNGGAGHVHQSEFIKPLHLTTRELEDIEDFLLSLTDQKFIQNEKFRLQ